MTEVVVFSLGVEWLLFSHFLSSSLHLVHLSLLTSLIATSAASGSASSASTPEAASATSVVWFIFGLPSLFVEVLLLVSVLSCLLLWVEAFLPVVLGLGGVVLLLGLFVPLILLLLLLLIVVLLHLLVVNLLFVGLGNVGLLVLRLECLFVCPGLLALGGLICAISICVVLLTHLKIVKIKLELLP